MTKTKNNTLNVFDKFIASLRKLYEKKYDNPIEIYSNLGKIEKLDTWLEKLLQK